MDWTRKTYRVGILLTTALLVGCAGSNNAPITSIGDSSRSGTYVVKRGDTLYAIARRYHVSINHLVKLNGLSDPSQLEVGQRIRVGAASRPAPASKPASKPSSTPAHVSTASDAYKVSWAWPVKGRIIREYSASTRGIDIAGKIGDPVKAAASGTVSYVGNGLRGLGNLILITHSSGFISAYAHNHKLLVKQNQKVSKGQKIAELGQSDTTSPRLHFEIRRNGTPVNPHAYLPR